MAAPHTNLNQFVSGQSVIEALGLFGGSPGRPVECPRCHAATLRMVRDPLGGNRFVCRNCRLNADSIRLYAVARSLGLREATAELRSRTSLPTSTLRGWFTAWSKYLAEPEQRLMELLDRGREELVVNVGCWHSQLEALQAWQGRDPVTLDRTLGRTLSACRREDLREAITPWALPGSLRRIDRFLVLPFCDVYNRPRSLLLFDHNKKEHWMRLPLVGDANRPDETHDSGLCFLDSVAEDGEDVVYAVGGGRLALQLRLQYAYDRSDPLPLVGWLPTTGAASWRNVRASRVLFWAPRLDADVFRQARYATNAYVCSQPDLSTLATAEALYTRLREMDTVGWRREARTSAVPWTEALGAWLLRLGDEAAVDALDRLALTGDEAERVANTASGANREKLVELFGLADATRSAVVDHVTIVESNHTWTSVTPLGPAPILDAVIRLDRIQSPLDSNAGVFYAVGYITRAGQVITFRDRLDEVQNNTAGWLTAKFAAARMSLPQISPTWAKKLFRIAQAFHNPPVVPYVRRVGWVDNLGLVFPQFMFRNGAVTSGEHVPDLDNTGIPGQRLAPPQFPAQVSSEALTVTSSSVAVWSILTAIIANAEAQRYGSETKGIAVVATEAADANFVAVRQLAEQLNLPWTESTTGTELAALDVGHVLPPVVDLRRMPAPTEPLLRYLVDPRPKSLLLVVPSLEAWREMSLGGWLGVLDRSKKPSQFPYEDLPRMFFSALRHAQLQNSELPTLPSYQEIFYQSAASLLLDRPPAPDAILELQSQLHQGVIGDKQWFSADTDRALFPLIWMADQRQTVFETYAHEGQTVLRIPAGELIRHIASVMKVQLDLEQIRYLLRKAGYLLGMPDDSIDIRQSNWGSATRQYRTLVPPENV